jgi:propionyl-CoA carboxylase beta chain
VDLLFDQGSFREIGMHAHSDVPEIGAEAAADAVITGMGTVDGRPVVVVAIDATTLGGSNGRIGLRKQGHMNYLAEKKGVPLVVLGDSSGGRMPDMLDATFAEANGLYEGEVVFGLRHRRVRIPRVTAIMGPSYGDPSFYGAASDFVCMTKSSSMGLSGPPVVEGAIGVRVTHEELAGPDVVAKTSGLVHSIVDDDPSCIATARRFLSYMPTNSAIEPPRAADWRPPEADPMSLYELVPDNFRRAYDVRKVIDVVVDQDSFLEVLNRFGRTVVGGLARMEGAPVVLVANQPSHMAGVADDEGLQKARALVDLANGFGLPIVFLQDLPGVMVGPEVERRGILRHAISILSALSNVDVPMVTVILRKAYGFGWVLFGGYPSGADYVVAWPNAQIGFMAPETGARVIHRREIERRRAQDGADAANAYVTEAAALIAHASEPWAPASRAALHDVIRPEETRKAILDGLFIGKSWIPETPPRGSRLRMT